jgi:hypothetical protein
MMLYCSTMEGWIEGETGRREQLLPEAVLTEEQL